MAFQSKYTGSQIESILGNSEKKIVATVDLGYDSFDSILDTSFGKESCPLSYCNIDGITNLVDLMKFVFFTKDASKGYSIDLSVKLNGNIVRELTCSISSVVDDYRLNIFDPESLLGGYITYYNSQQEVLISKSYLLPNTENENFVRTYKLTNDILSLINLFRSLNPPYRLIWSIENYSINLYFYGIYIYNNQISYINNTQAVTLNTTMILDVSAKVETGSQFYIRGFANFNFTNGLLEGVNCGFGNFEFHTGNGRLRLYGIINTKV